MEKRHSGRNSAGLSGKTYDRRLILGISPSCQGSRPAGGSCFAELCFTAAGTPPVEARSVSRAFTSNWSLGGQGPVLFLSGCSPPHPSPPPPGGLAGNKPLTLHAGCSPGERCSTDELHYLPFLLHRLAGSPASIFFFPPRGSWHHESLKLDEMKVSSYGTRRSLHRNVFFFLQIFQRVIRNHFQKRHVEPSTASDVKETYLKMH